MTNIYLSIGILLAFIYFMIVIVNAMWRIGDADLLLTGLYDDATDVFDYVFFAMAAFVAALAIIIFWLPIVLGMVLFIKNEN